MVIGYGNETVGLTEQQAREIMAEAFSQLDVDGKKVLILIPDRTRSGPIPMFFKLFYELIGERVEKLDYLVALGTHPPLDDGQIDHLLDIAPGDAQ